MFKARNIISVSLSLALLLTTNAFAQGTGKNAGAKRKTNTSAKNKRKSGKYANQEVSYRQTGTTRKFDKGYLPPAASKQTDPQTALSGTGQSKLKQPKPKQQNLLPYMEQSNLRHRKAQTRK